MIKPVVRDTFFLARKSVPATDCPEDRQTIRDLLDTLAANREHCVGMAANMIGVTKRIIVVNAGFVDFRSIRSLPPKTVLTKPKKAACL